LTKPNVELVTDAIDRFSGDGIVTTDGKLRPADIVVVSNRLQGHRDGGAP